MATIADIQNILVHAKKGQYISINCQKTAAVFDATVVQLKEDEVQAINADDWEEGWPEEKGSGPLCFTAIEAGAAISLNNVDGQYVTSTTGEDGSWVDYTIGSSVVLNNVGDKVYFSAKTTNDNCCYRINGDKFRITKRVNASGSVQYLMDSTGKRTDVPYKGFWMLFKGCRWLMTAPEFPATTVGELAYCSAFQGCTSLTVAPELPATSLGRECYCWMFGYCSALTTPPTVLPASTLINGCYSNMFNYCTALTKCPELPAETLAEYCYDAMFYYCTHLAQNVELPALTIPRFAYRTMFQGCSALTGVQDLPATTLNYCSYQLMFGSSGVTTVNMKQSMSGVYNASTHGALGSVTTINYTL